MKDATATMGGLLTDETNPGTKDAVHVAVIAVVAATRMQPGQHVGVNTANMFAHAVGFEHVGIVDPYLKAAVPAGYTFWLFLYPRSITGLNHVWTHPAFDNAATEYVKPADRAVSGVWLKEFMDRIECRSIDDLKEAIKYDGCFGYDTSYADIPAEFWQHYKNVTGQDVPEKDRPQYFRCAC